jgi:hypothetical protein
MKSIVWFFVDKNSFISSNELLRSKNGLVVWLEHHKIEKNYIDSHSKFVIGTQYIM